MLPYTLSIHASGFGRGALHFAYIRVRLVCAHKTMHRMVLSPGGGGRAGALRGQSLQPETSCFGLSGGAHSVLRTSVYAWSAPTKPCTAWFCPRRGGCRRDGQSLTRRRGETARWYPSGASPLPLKRRFASPSCASSLFFL